MEGEMEKFISLDTVEWRRKGGECFAYLVLNLIEITWEGQTIVYFGGKMQFSSNKC